MEARFTGYWKKNKRKKNKQHQYYRRVFVSSVDTVLQTFM